MKNPRRLLLPAFLCALLAALVLASGASAATYVGAATSPEDSTITNGEEDLLGATAEYESTTGALTITATTRSEPTENTELSLVAAVFTSPSGSCAIPHSQAEAEASLPVLEVASPYAKSEGHDESFWFFRKSLQEQASQENAGQAVRTVAGAETTVTATPTKAAAHVFNCGLIGVSKNGPSGPTDSVAFPLTLKAEPTPPVVVTTPPTTTTTTVTKTVVVQAPAPTLTPGLAFPSAAPLKLKRERWTTVRFKITNPGTAPIGPLSIKAKAPKGVRLEPGTVKLPALLPGQTWPVSFRIEVTEKAAAHPRIALTATGSGLSASGSVLIKPTG